MTTYSQQQSQAKPHAYTQFLRCIQRSIKCGASLRGFFRTIETPTVHSSQHPRQEEILRQPSLLRIFKTVSTESHNISPSSKSDLAGQAKSCPSGFIARYNSPA